MAVAFLCLQLNSYTIMSKQKRMVEVPVTDKKEQERLQVTRMTFACLLMIVMQHGQDGMYDFLKDKSPKAIMEYAEIRDECKNDPIGAVIQRPAFEVYRELAKGRKL